MLRTYEAGVGVMIMLVALIQFVMFSAGRLGEQWDSTDLDVEVKKALASFQTVAASDVLSRYSKIRDPDLMSVPESETTGYRILINGEAVDKTVTPPEGEVATADARVYHLSRDAPRLARSLSQRLLRSSYVAAVGGTMDYDSVDELADLAITLSYYENSNDIVEGRVRAIIESQNDDGGWGFTEGDESNTLCTSMAIRAISVWIKKTVGDPLSNSTVSGGISWLKNGVHADGGYGSKERIESSIDMTACVLLAYIEAGLGGGDQWVSNAEDYLLRAQRADGGFPISRRTRSHVSSTAVAVEALMASNAPQSKVEDAVSFLEARMIDGGNFTFLLTPLGGSGTYNLTVYTGYLVDCSPRGHEFWGEHTEDSYVQITDVQGSSDNMTVEVKIDRQSLAPPENQQKIALALSHDRFIDADDWWILNAGNPHVSGQGEKIDSPQFEVTVRDGYTYLTITNLQVPDGYEFFSESEDVLIVVVGDGEHPIKDNPGHGLQVGYWDPWMKSFDYRPILAWRAWSPRVNYACLDLDQDGEFDDRRLFDGDAVVVEGNEWEVGMTQNEDSLNLTFTRAGLNYTRIYSPLKYDLSSIPESASGLYHFGIISATNKPSFSKDFKVVLRDSTEPGTYDQAYIWNGSTWNYFPDGSTWNQSGTIWVVGIEGDFLTLTRSNPIEVNAIRGRGRISSILEGDFLRVEAEPDGPKEVWLTLYHDSEEIARAVFTEDLEGAFEQIFGTWGDMRETSKVYHALSLAESWLEDKASVQSVHQAADLSQQAIKFGKVYNSVIEDTLSIEAWFKSGGGE